GKTSCNVFNQKINYAPVVVSIVTEFQVPKCGSHIVKIRRDVLYPKRTKYSKYFKCRCSRGREPDGTQLGFGRYGTKSCRAGRLSYRAIEAARQATIRQFHRAMSGQFQRNCKIWVRVSQIFLLRGNPQKFEWEEEKEIRRVGLLVCPRDKSHLKWMV
uniref:Uncharacterized protein n=1 Tax=Aegilops tauschii subsp. strangulata TaxID=200361 RepID=A0A452Z3Y3_AEGTS